MRAGVPQVVRSFLGDQRFWARRVHETGIAAPPLTGRLTADRLAAAIDDAASRADAARATAERIGAEDGAVAAVERIERVARG
jgi:sterol 3beta-glucosyltransferase